MNVHLKKLDDIFEKYNKRELVVPDPLQFLYNYDRLVDREIAGLIASSLAYGRVQQILISIAKVLDVMGDSPYDFIHSKTFEELDEIYSGFKHRFTTGNDIALFLDALRDITAETGSIEAAFMQGYSDDDETLLPAMTHFVARIANRFEGGKTYLLPSPTKGSACKRFNLFLRWMVRHDEVDPGGWNNLPASKLLTPLDTHMNNICTSAGMLKRKNADLKAVIEITDWFKNINPEDPVKYDFALTRFGIRDDMAIEDLLRSMA